MSPRAAWRLETLGFTRVYEYAAGKADWGAYGLPVEGTVTKVPPIQQLARTDVPTCRLAETIRDVRARVGTCASGRRARRRGSGRVASSVVGAGDSATRRCTRSTGCRRD